VVIVTDGSERGEIRKVCANPECPVHHPKKQRQGGQADAAFKAQQEKQRREEALAQATGLRVLKAIGDAVPVRLMKRDLLFAAVRLTGALDERRQAVLIRQHSIGKPKDGEAPAKLLAAFLPKAEESTLGRVVVEAVILLSMHNQSDSAKILRDAATATLAYPGRLLAHSLMKSSHWSAENNATLSMGGIGCPVATTNGSSFARCG
jgi:ParB family transcriptional regulator, chromosome partitioning protein